VNTQVDRAHCRPWGLDGGREGAGNQVAIRLGGKWKDDFPNAKVLVAQLKGGDAYRMRSGGGGGHGDPHARPVAAVAEDVRQGYVSAKAARADYGVVVDPVSFAVDQKATQRLRGRRAAGKPKRARGGKTARKRAKTS
jgi:N-methylhydantoinase B